MLDFINPIKKDTDIQTKKYTMVLNETWHLGTAFLSFSTKYLIKMS